MNMNRPFFLVFMAIAFNAIAGDLAQVGPPLPHARMGHYAATLSDGTVVLFGGRGPNFISLSSVEQFNPTTTNYTSYSLQSGHDMSAFTRLPDGTLLIVGGASDLGIPTYDLIEVYDPVSHTVLRTSHLKKFRSGAQAAVLTGGKALVAGGWWTHNDAYHFPEIIDLGNLASTLTGPLAQVRSYPYVIPLNDGGGLVLGGLSQTGGDIPPSPERFDPASGNFQTFPVGLFQDRPNLRLDSYSFQRDIADVQLAGRRYVLLAREGTNYCFLAITSAGIASVLIPAEKLPNPATLPVWQYVVDAKRGYIHVMGTEYPSGNSQVRISINTFDADGNLIGSQSTALLPLGYYLSSASVSLLNDGALFVAGGTTSDYYAAVTGTLVLRPQLQAQPTLTLQMFPGLWLTGGVGITYSVQYSTTLTNWVPLTDVQLTNSPQLFIDLTAQGTCRFYRMEQKP
jgi:hypothetical protein